MFTAEKTQLEIQVNWGCVQFPGLQLLLLEIHWWSLNWTVVTLSVITTEITALFKWNFFLEILVPASPTAADSLDPRSSLWSLFVCLDILKISVAVARRSSHPSELLVSFLRSSRLRCSFSFPSVAGLFFSSHQAVCISHLLFLSGVLTL